MTQADVSIATVVSRPFAENTFIAHLPGRTDCVIVDPGMEPQRIVNYVQQQGLTPAALLITHGHGDHIAGIGPLRSVWPECPIVIGRHEANKLIDPVANLSADLGVPVTTPPADVLLDHGQTYEAAGFTFDIRAIPGHSSGHIVFIWREHNPPIVFGGDVLFAGSIGRTDFPGGSFKQLAAGIHEHLFTLPADTVVLSGHGPATTVGAEKENNPFVGKRAGRGASEE
ncbi:MAG: MBL fold metallo-hydrolase [Planctomycetaceae bacterium]|nr:MBL fold metallo-hydrolase [Planctomycetaceae bacterium]